MAKMTPEAKVKRDVTTMLKQRGAYYFYPVAGALGARAGIPDIIVCYRGWFIAIECKAGKGKATDYQLNQIEAIQKADGIAFVVNELNIGAVQDIMDDIDRYEEEVCTHTQA